jgi:hypothetical protein
MCTLNIKSGFCLNVVGIYRITVFTKDELMRIHKLLPKIEPFSQVSVSHKIQWAWHKGEGVWYSVPCNYYKNNKMIKRLLL